MWRGSANQKIHSMSDRYRMLENTDDRTLECRGYQVEFAIGCKEYSATGVWTTNFIEELNEIIRRCHERP
jgi:hypothetical protein